MKAFVTVTIVTIVVALLAVICLMGGGCQAREAQDRLTKLYNEASEEIARANAAIEQTNADNEADYQRRLAEYRASLQQNEGKNVSWPSPATGKGWEVVDLTGFELDDPTYVNISRQDMLYNGLLVVNQWHPRPSDFDESKVLNVHSKNKEIPLADHKKRLLESAITAWGQLLGDAKTQFQWDYIILDDCFRSYDEQKELYDKAADKVKDKYDDPEELRANVSKSTAYPGTSEFNTGLSASARMYKNGDGTKTVNSSDFLKREEGKWVVEHCWEYGLTFRFPRLDVPTEGTQDKRYLTGVNANLNLFRYVGAGNAAAMHALGDLCLEEYIDYLADHPHIAVCEDGQVRYEIWREAVPNAATVRVTHTGKMSDSKQESFLDNLTYFDGDNIEWAFVVTVLTY